MDCPALGVVFEGRVLVGLRRSHMYSGSDPMVIKAPASGKTRVLEDIIRKG